MMASGDWCWASLLLLHIQSAIGRLNCFLLQLPTVFCRKIFCRSYTERQDSYQDVSTQTSDRLFFCICRLHEAGGKWFTQTTLPPNGYKQQISHRFWKCVYESICMCRRSKSIDFNRFAVFAINIFSIFAPNQSSALHSPSVSVTSPPKKGVISLKPGECTLLVVFYKHKISFYMFKLI